MDTIKTKADALKAGIHKQAVAAFRLHDGTCPVGVVDELHADHFTVALFSWLGGEFGEGYRDVAYAEVHSVVKTTYELEGNGYKVFQVDHLGKAQTEWIEGQR